MSKTRYATFVLGLVTVLVLLFPTVSAIDLKPQPIPGLEEYVSLFLSWIYWAAIVFCVFLIIVGIFFLRKGEDKRDWIIYGFGGLAFLLALPKILEALGV